MWFQIIFLLLEQVFWSFSKKNRSTKMRPISFSTNIMITIHLSLAIQYNLHQYYQYLCNSGKVHTVQKNLTPWLSSNKISSAFLAASRVFNDLINTSVSSPWNSKMKYKVINDYFIIKAIINRIDWRLPWSDVSSPCVNSNNVHTDPTKPFSCAQLYIISPHSSRVCQ